MEPGETYVDSLIFLGMVHLTLGIVTVVNIGRCEQKMSASLRLRLILVLPA
jgi:hypothetical protein